MTGLPEGVSIGDFGDAVLAQGVRAARRRRDGHGREERAATSVWIGLPADARSGADPRFDIVNSVVAQAGAEARADAPPSSTRTRCSRPTPAATPSTSRDAHRRRRSKVRADDGVHFERAGGDIIAREVLKTLNRTYDLTSWKRKQKAT